MISKTLDGWKFITELALENFVWENLNILFDIAPFKQQYNSATNSLLRQSSKRNAIFKRN
jgi:hypothetical protein